MEFEPTLPLYVDSSMLSTWRSCRRKHFWSSINALYPTGRSVHLIAGAALASGVEAARRRVFTSPDPFSLTLDDMLHAAYKPFLNEWGDFEPPEKSSKTFVHTWAALVHYLTEYPPATDPVQPYIRPDGTPAVEYRFSIPLEVDHPSGDPFVFVGRFDMLGMYKIGDQQIIAPVDEKSTTSIGFSWSDQWSLRGQFIGYVWACRQAGLDVDRAIVRGISILKTQNKVVTALPVFPQHVIDRWYKQLIMDVVAMRDAFLAYKHGGVEDFWYPYNFADACNSYGGCAFTTLCEAREPESFFTNYVRHRWDPLAKQPVQELENAHATAA